MRQIKFLALTVFCISTFVKANIFSTQLGIIAGYSNLSDLVFFTNDISRQGLGLNNGVNIGLKAAVNIFSFDLNAKYRYYHFGANGHSNGVIEGHHSMTIPHQVDTNFKIKAFSLGIEWKILTIKGIRPFIYFDYFLDTNIQSIISKNPDDKNLPAPYENVRTDFSFKENNRHGIALGVGLQILITAQLNGGISLERINFPGNSKERNLSSIYSFAFMQEDISIISLNATFSYAF